MTNKNKINIQPRKSRKFRKSKNKIINRFNRKSSKKTNYFKGGKNIKNINKRILKVGGGDKVTVTTGKVTTRKVTTSWIGDDHPPSYSELILAREAKKSNYKYKYTIQFTNEPSLFNNSFRTIYSSGNVVEGAVEQGDDPVVTAKDIGTITDFVDSLFTEPAANDHEIIKQLKDIISKYTEKLNNHLTDYKKINNNVEQEHNKNTFICKNAQFSTKYEYDYVGIHKKKKNKHDKRPFENLTLLPFIWAVTIVKTMKPKIIF